MNIDDKCQELIPKIIRQMCRSCISPRYQVCLDYSRLRGSLDLVFLTRVTRLAISFVGPGSPMCFKRNIKFDKSAFIHFIYTHKRFLHFTWKELILQCSILAGSIFCEEEQNIYDILPAGDFLPGVMTDIVVVTAFGLSAVDTLIPANESSRIIELI